MNINEAIDNQFALLATHVAYTTENEKRKRSGSSTMNELFVIRSLVDTLADMISARDCGESVW